jgi:hypothetical protein
MLPQPCGKPLLLKQVRLRLPKYYVLCQTGMPVLTEFPLTSCQQFRIRIQHFQQADQ